MRFSFESTPNDGRAEHPLLIVVHGGGWSAGNKNRVHGHTVRLDRLSGKETLVYTKALDLTVTPKQEKTRRGSFRDMVSRAEDLQLRVSGGVLAQAMREKLVILDAKTGERLWSRDAGDELSLVHPIIANETFYVAEGRCARHSSYAHWPTERSSSYWKTVRSSP